MNLLFRIRTLYHDGALSWRNPLVLALYCVLASVVMLVCFLNSQSASLTVAAVAVWVFTAGVIGFCIMIVALGCIPRKRNKSVRKGEHPHSKPSVQDRHWPR